MAYGDEGVLPYKCRSIQLMVIGVFPKEWLYRRELEYTRCGECVFGYHDCIVKCGLTKPSSGKSLFDSALECALQFDGGMSDAALLYNS